MRQWIRWIVSIVLLLVLPAMAMADVTADGAGASFGFFPVAPTDRSLYYLSLIFGPVGSIFPDYTTGSNGLAGELFRYFNTFMLTVGVSMASYTAILGVMKSAQEGEVLGRQWSTFLVPTKAGLGVLLLAPTASGYSFIQVTLMGLILNSIGAANALWETAYYTHLNAPHVIQTESTSTMQEDLLDDIDALTGQLLKMALCTQMVNQNPNYFFSESSVGNEIRLSASPVTTIPVSMTLKKQVQAPRFLQAGNDDFAQYCGAVNFSAMIKTLALTSNHRSMDEVSEMVMQRFDTIQQAFDLLRLAASSYVDTFVWGYPEDTEGTFPPPDGVPFSAKWNDPSDVDSVPSSVLSAIEQTKLYLYEALTDSFYGSILKEKSLDTALIDDGWIHAGSYYYHLMAITEEASDFAVSNGIKVSAPTLGEGLSPRITTDDASSMIRKLGYFTEGTMDEVSELRQLYAGLENEDRLTLPPVVDTSLPGTRATLWGKLQTPLMRLADKIVSEHEDPLVSMGNTGKRVITGIESAWLYLIIISFVALILQLMPCANSLGHAISVAVKYASVILTIAIVVLWAGSSVLAFYIPLIPYFVFTFTAISWFISVIEAMVAAPLVALAFMAPSQDEFGRAGQALMMVTGLFLKPILMIIGFLFASSLVKIVFDILRFGFQATLDSLVGTQPFFAFVAIFITYIGIASSLINECFSLIYLLPDKAMRWMGGQGDQSNVAQMMQKLKQSAEKGGQTSQKMAQGGAQMASGISGLGDQMKGGK